MQGACFFLFIYRFTFLNTFINSYYTIYDPLEDEKVTYRDGSSRMASGKACENGQCLLILHEKFGCQVPGPNPKSREWCSKSSSEALLSSPGEKLVTDLFSQNPFYLPFEHVISPHVASPVI